MKSSHVGFVMIALASLATACGSSASSAPASTIPARTIADPMVAPSLSNGPLPASPGLHVIRPPFTMLAPAPSAAAQTVNGVGPWELNATADSMQQLLIITPGLACTNLWRIRVTESSRWVVITPDLSVPAHGVSKCADININRTWLVDLGAPLGIGSFFTRMQRSQRATHLRSWARRVE